MENEDLKDFIVKLGLTDLLLYRSEKETGLNEIQEKSWGKVLYLIKDHYRLDLKITKGVMPIEQSDDMAKNLYNIIDEIDEDKLFYFYGVSRILGSTMLTLALYSNFITVDEAFEYSIIDEEWQNRISGYDEEDLERRNKIKQDYNKLVDELMKNEA